MKKIALLFFALLVFADFSFSQSWQMVGTGSNALKANNTIAAVCADTGGVVYAGGVFTDGLPYPSGQFYVAKWDGATWSRLGYGSDSIFANGGVSTMCIDAAHNLYVAGAFRDINGKCFVAKWDGNSWRELGTDSNGLNANGYIYSICVDGTGNVYAAGNFSDSALATIGHKYVARWNGILWDKLGTGSNSLNATLDIRSIIVGADGWIYAGTYRPITGGWWSVAVWNGASWNELGTGTNALKANGAIWALCHDYSGNIYAAGFFTDGLGNAYLAKWDGTSWHNLGVLAGAAPLLSICSDKFNNIFAAGYSSGSHDYFVSEWDGVSWKEVGSGSGALNANGDVFAICTDTGSNIYAAGNFTDSVSGYGRRYVARYYDRYTAVRPSLARIQPNIFPNPANNSIVISIPRQAIGYSFQLINARGLMVEKVVLKQETTILDLSALESGVYLVQIDAIWSRTLIIKK